MAPGLEALAHGSNEEGVGGAVGDLRHVDRLIRLGKLTHRSVAAVVGIEFGWLPSADRQDMDITGKMAEAEAVLIEIRSADGRISEQRQIAFVCWVVGGVFPW